MEEGYTDKKATLIVFGIFEIIGGLLCALFFAVSLASVLVVSDEMPVKQALVGSSVYAFLAIWQVWLGIGTIRARRWARLLMLSASWIMLYCGAMAMGMVAFIFPRSFAGANLPEATMVPVLIAIYVILAVIYLVIPGVGILLYGNRNVRATFEHRDPVLSWMDGCPLPILILVLMLLVGGASSMMMMSFLNFALPFFGVIVSGWLGAVILVGCVAAGLFLAQGAYKLKPWAWWGVLVGLLFCVGSQVITYQYVDVMDYYVTMGYSDQMLVQLNSMEWVNGRTFTIMTLVYGLPGLIYLLCIKRYFKNEETTR